jgi:hypothetical protein
MPLTLYALDNFVAQDLSQLTECRPTPIEPDFPDYKTWLNSFVLTRIFRVPLEQNKAALAFALIRRAEAAISDYEEARTDLASLATEKSISAYFRCLRKFESAVTALYQAFDFARKALGMKLFEKGGGSPYDRLNWIYNKTKHGNPEKLPQGHLHAVWLRNEGLFTDEASLAFHELEDMIHQVGRIADKLAKGKVPS